MTRTSPSDVTELFDTDLATNVVQSWIEIATEDIDDVSDADSSISSTRLEKMEKLWTAGLMQAQDPRVSKDKVGGSSMTLEVVDYRDLAIGMDSTGVLANKKEPRQRASISDINARNIDRPDRD